MKTEIVLLDKEKVYPSVFVRYGILCACSLEDLEKKHIPIPLEIYDLFSPKKTVYAKDRLELSGYETDFAEWDSFGRFIKLREEFYHIK